MRKMRRKMGTGMAVCLIAALLFIGCGSKDNSAADADRETLSAQLADLQQQLSDLQQQLAAAGESGAQQEPAAGGQESGAPSQEATSVPESTQSGTGENGQGTVWHHVDPHHDDTHHTEEHHGTGTTAGSSTASGEQAASGNGAGAGSSEAAGTGAASGSRLQELTAVVDDFVAEAASLTSGQGNADLEQFFAAKQNAAEIENELDFYEDELEAQVRSGALSGADYRSLERELESQEDRLDRAEDDLERFFGIDD